MDLQHSSGTVCLSTQCTACYCTPAMIKTLRGKALVGWLWWTVKVCVLHGRCLAPTPHNSGMALVRTASNKDIECIPHPPPPPSQHMHVPVATCMMNHAARCSIHTYHQATNGPSQGPLMPTEVCNLYLYLDTRLQPHVPLDTYT